MRDKLDILKQIMKEKGVPVTHNYGRMNTSAFMTEFFVKVYSLKSLMSQIQTYHAQIRKIHNDILSSPEQSSENKVELENLMENVKRETSIVRMQLKEIEKEIPNDKSFNEKCQSTEIRIKKTQHSALLYRFTDLMTKYNLSQVDFRSRCKDRIHRQLSIANQEMNDEELENILEQGSIAIFTQDIMTETEQAKRSLADVEARHLDIIKLEKSIKELHEMFVDMAILIESQGEMVDRIEYHVAKAQDYVEQAVVDTRKAVSYHKSASKKKIIIGVIITVIILLFVAIILGSVIKRE